MAQVPYSPIPNVSSNLQPTPQIHVDTPPAAFGDNIAKAVQQLGASTDQVGNELWQRAMAMQDLHNQSASDTAATGFGKDLSTLHANFTSQYGENAGPVALTKYNNDVSDLRDKYRQTLTNEVAQRYYDHDTLRQQAFAFSGAAEHAARQLDVTQKASAGALADSAADLAITTGRPAAMADARAKAAAAVEIQNRGMPPEVIVQKQAQSVSALNYKQVSALINNGNVDDAKKLIDGYKSAGTLLGQDAENADKLFTSKMLTVVPARAAATVNARMPDATPSDKVLAIKAEIAKIVPKSDPNFDLYQEAGENKIKTDIGVDQAIKTQASQQSISALEGSLIKASQAGQPVTDINQLRSDPKNAAIIDNLAKTDPNEMLKLQMKIQDINKTMRENDVTPAREANFNRLNGAAHSQDPSEFMKMNLSNFDLTASQLRALQDAKDRLLKENGKPLDSPHLETVMANPNIQAKLRAAGASKDISPDEYNKFQGAMQSEIQKVLATGKAPTYENLEEIGTRLLQQQVTAKGYLWNSHAYVYQTKNPDTGWTKDVPPDQYNSIRAQGLAKGRTLNDTEIQRIYSRKIFNDSLGKPKEEQ